MARIIASLLLAFTAGNYVQAAEPTLITLSCDGTLTYTHITDSKPYPGGSEQVQKLGVVVNPDERTVSFVGYVSRISDADAANINFGGKQIGRVDEGVKISIMGEIDRVTGRMDAMTTTEIPTTLPGYNALQSHYELSCKAANRVF